MQHHGGFDRELCPVGSCERDTIRLLMSRLNGVSREAITEVLRHVLEIR